MEFQLWWTVTKGRGSLELVAALYESMASGHEVGLPFTSKYSPLGLRKR